MSFVTATNTELLYASPKAANAKATFTTEIAINDNTTGGLGAQAHLPADFWLPNPTSVGKAIRIYAQGIVSGVSTNTWAWTVRLGAANSITAAEVLGTGTLTPAATITNVPWWFDGTVVLETLGAAGANSTVRGTGFLLTDGFSAATTTRAYPLYGTHASPGTVATLDTSITNYINFNIVSGASSGSNSITLQQLLVYGLN